MKGAKVEETGELFEDLPVPQQRPVATAGVSAPARVRRPNRRQVELRACDLESLLAEDHPARLVWAYVQRQDISALYEPIKVVEGSAGRSAIAPEIVLSLWLYATLDGVGSARALERLCRSHDAYRWICGGVSVNHHSLSDFRVGHGEFLERLLTRNVTALLASGAVKMKRVAQDGMRVRGDAGASSYRRRESLERCHRDALAQVEALKRELHDDPTATNRREQAARQRAAAEREQRLARALEVLPELEQRKRSQGADAGRARASSTDAEANVMKMADGGFRPAYNVQLASDTGTQVILGVDVITGGSDLGEMAPMVGQLRARYGRRPKEYLVDGGFAKHADIESLAPLTVVYAPVQAPKDSAREPHLARAHDSAVIAEWRTRMGTEPAKEIYKERAATAECVNAQARNRGLTRFNVRGLAKVKAALLWFVLAHNFVRTLAIAPELAS